MNIKVGSSEELYEVRKINNLKEMIYGSTKLYKNNVAFRYRDNDGEGNNFITVTYSQLEHDLTCLGTALFSLGLHNKKIAVIGRNSYYWGLAYLAAVCGTRNCHSN